MVMTRSTAIGSIVTGSILLGFAIISVICGAISASKMSGAAAASAGLWSLFFAVPGILSIVAGATKNGIVMGFALFFNIIAVIVSSIATLVLILATILFASLKSKWESNECSSSGEGGCSCGDETYTMDCGDINTIFIVFIAVLVLYIILTITTFSASIFGCLGTCCAPHDPVFVVSAGVPAQPAGTVVVTSNQSSLQQGYFPQPNVSQPPPPVYGYGAPPPFDHDKAGLLKHEAM
ncbi:uncharacterized protein LOC124450236 isoform X2 [Xenia sp. Carnegie-2017]|uniref:uncharacterized protein LOC124450236 isoform X2 n=1 Tax=Xenia sp. Carnegie-2017 TaxID=2897299 RepID=UPI001F046A39|nr:uncharacterized protein LOC124450236 isoform X2 [Xenia sp. Carnegie-2017]